MDSDHLRYLIDQYVRGACTRQEMEELLNYIEQHPDDAHLPGLLPDVSQAELRNEEDAPSWSEFQQTLSASESLRVREDTHRSGLWTGSWLKIAACISLVVIAAATWLNWPSGNSYTGVDPLRTQNRDAVTSSAEHRLIVLPDNSKVWINGGSRIIADENFNQQTRGITLYGEAFFDIKSDPDRPFIISTGEVKTTVLGTAFNIRAFPQESEVTVTVARGSVFVETENRRGGMLTANQQIKVDLKNDHVQESPVDAAAVSQWTQDDLILYEVTMDEAAGILKERYNKEIRFENSDLKLCRFTSTLTWGASLEEVLTAICMVNNATFAIDGDSIKISGQGCVASVRSESPADNQKPNK